MQSTLLHKDQQKTFNARHVKKCGFCEHSNPAVAKFCGGCGRSTRFSRVEAVTEIAAGVGTEENNYQTRPVSKLTALQKYFFRNKSIAAICLIVLLFCLPGAFYISKPSQEPNETARWSDFRAFLARKLEIPHYELDTVFLQLFSLPTNETTLINIEQTARLESFFRESFNQPALSLFPNPFFERKTISKAQPSAPGNLFVDVSTGHPIYDVIKPLTALGMTCGDTASQIRPEDKITWSDWKKLTSELIRTLSLDTAFIERLCANQTGTMSNLDIRNFVEHMREKLFIKSTVPLIYAREKFFPSRIEAFGVLAAIIRELSTN